MNDEGAVRSAKALLRVNGGRSVLLRVPVPAVPGNAAEELGLVTPQFNDRTLQPAVFRKTNSTATLLVAAPTLLAAAEGTTPEALRKTTAGIVVDDVMYTVTNIVAEQTNGATYCYALQLRAPAW